MAALCALAVLSAAAPVAGEVYKWVDKDGRVVYGDRPPVSQTPEALEDISVYEPAVSRGARSTPRAPAADGSAVASCIAGSGAMLYGASWCGQCRKQLAAFGAGAGSLPYVECSIDGTRKTARACVNAGIKGYPTWVFADGQRHAGVMSVKALAAAAGCT